MDGEISREGTTGLITGSFEQVRHSRGKYSPFDSWTGALVLKDSTNNHGRKYNDNSCNVEADGWRSGTGGLEVVRKAGPVGSFS